MSIIKHTIACQVMKKGNPDKSVDQSIVSMHDFFSCLPLIVLCLL